MLQDFTSFRYGDTDGHSIVHLLNPGLEPAHFSIYHFDRSGRLLIDRSLSSTVESMAGRSYRTRGDSHDLYSVVVVSDRALLVDGENGVFGSGRDSSRRLDPVAIDCARPAGYEAICRFDPASR